ncbi:hypothetical protein DFQ26_007519 [Actinomortierella ambigua]|nr:hypothetical protein DFQ26_007519 [Actinomortierella ambigua]
MTRKDSSKTAQLRIQHILNTMGGPSAPLEHAAHRLKPANTQANRSELNPVHFLARSATVYPQKTAVVHGDRRYTYQQLNRRVLGLAYALKQQYGIGHGDRVAILAPNIPAMLEAHFAIPACQAIIVAINTRLNPKEVAYILNHSGARLILCDAEFANLVQDSPLPKVFIEDSGRIDSDPYEQFLGLGYPLADKLGWGGLDQVRDENDGISICYTSGTTGNPKGVLYTYRGIYLAALGNAIEAGLSINSVHMFVVPLFHANSWMFPYSVTAVTATHVMMRKVDYDAMWKALKQEGVTHMNGAPTIMIQLVHHPEAKKFDHPITCTVAGSAPTAALIEEMQQLNMSICHVYGLTETYGPAVRNAEQLPADMNAQDKAKRLARQGHAYLVSDDIKVVNSKMEEVAWNGVEMGEIVFRGNLVMKEYFNDPKATEKAFQGGWFHTGDLAVRHPDGYIAIQDRQKDIIISGGENISTLEVESCISSHPAVLEVAVLGIPHPKWGETPKGFVVLKPGQTATPDEIITYCKQNIAGFKCPSAVEIIKELPKTSTGKITKIALREKEWKGLAARVN